jgi:hypothetical protein
MKDVKEPIASLCDNCGTEKEHIKLYHEKKICGDCFIALETAREQEAMNFRTPNSNCFDCNAVLKETVHERQRSGKDSGTCVPCWYERIANSEETKAEIKKEKAIFDAKPVREKMFILLDEIDSCQDAMHPSSLKGYRNCLHSMKIYAQRRTDFEHDYKEQKMSIANGAHLWNLLIAVEEIASKYEEHESLETCKKMANFLEKLSQLRWMCESN